MDKFNLEFMKIAHELDRQGRIFRVILRHFKGDGGKAGLWWTDSTTSFDGKTPRELWDSGEHDLVELYVFKHFKPV